GGELVEGGVPPEEGMAQGEDEAPRAVAISPDIEVLATEAEAAMLAAPEASVPRAIPVQPPLDETPLEVEETLVEMTAADPRAADTVPVRRALPVTEEDFAAPMVGPEAEEPVLEESPVPEAPREDQVPRAMAVE
ncbi:MAG: hypothetical protein SNJ84_08675, partial [Verrucomicrobiia bacterium]